MGVLTSTLIMSLIDRVTAPARSIAGTIDRLQRAQEANSRQLDAMRGRMVEAAAVGYALAKAVGAPVKAAIEFESAMADVRKVVDFPTPAAFKTMGSDLIDMSRRIPIAATGLAAIAAEAGAAGMQAGELLAFTEMAAKVGVAFDISAGKAGNALAKLKTALRLSVADTGLLADAINHLSNGMASTAPEILAYMNRVGSTGKQYGFTAEQTAAIGSAMIASGAEAEVAATSFRNVGKALTKGEAATKSQLKAYAALGLDSVKVSKAMQKNASATLRDVLTRVKKLPRHMQAATLSQLFGDEARAFAPLVENLELYDEALGYVDQKVKYLNSSTKEYEARSKTTANSVQLFKNQLGALGIVVGSALLPALNSIMETLGPIIKRMADFAEAHPALTRAIVATTAALIALRVASIAAQFSFLWMRGGAIAGAIGGLRALQFAARGLGLPFLLAGRALATARTAMIGFGAAASVSGVSGALQIAARSALALLNPLRILRVVAIGLRAALLFSGVGTVIAAIAATGLLIYNNWEGVKSLIAGVADGFMTGLQPVMPVIRPIVDAVKSIWDSLAGLLGPLGASTGEWRSWGETIGGVAAGGVRAVIDAIGRLIGMFTTAYDKAKSIGSAIANWGSWSTNGGGSNPGAPGRMGPGGSVISGARAAGGPVVGGRTYLVGEEGEELFTPSRSGTIIPNHKLGGGMAPAGAGRSVSIGAIHVHPSPGMSEEGLARKVLALIERKLRDDMDGVQADIEYGVA